MNETINKLSGDRIKDKTMTWKMKLTARLAAITALTTAVAFASPSINGTFAQNTTTTAKEAPEARPEAGSTGAVFAMTNIAYRNQIVVFKRAADGTLTAVDRVPTGGSGKGDDFDTQGGLVLSDNHLFLYACNAGSNDISVFAVNGTKLTLIQKIFSGGVVPESLTFHDTLMYVLHGSVADNNISGFTVASDGTLSPLLNSTRALSSPIAVPGVVQFSPDGLVLVVTLKAAQVGVNPGPFVIDTFTVGSDGRPSMVKPNKSFGRRPFAATFRSDGFLIVAESHNPFPHQAAVSSYKVNPANGDLDVITGSERNGQTDSCWVLLSKDEHYAYTANFATGNISSFRSNQDGTIKLIDGAAAVLGLTSEPTDIRISEDGRFFYVLLRGTGEVAAFRIGDDGSLTPKGRVSGGLPANTGASGLAAY